MQTDAFGAEVEYPEARLLLDSLDSTLRSETMAQDRAAAELAAALAADRAEPYGLFVAGGRADGALATEAWARCRR